MGRGRSRKRSSSGSRSRSGSEGSPEPTKKCKNCGRSFAVSRLDKHEKICKKTTGKKPKVFDSGKQRAKNSDISYNHVQKARKQSIGAPKTNWRAKHDDFQNTVKSAKGGGGGGRARTPPDYEKCPGCGRKFNQKAAERHIPQCKAKNGKDDGGKGKGSRRGSEDGGRGSRGGGSKDRRGGSKDRRSGSSDKGGARKGRDGSKSRGDSKSRSSRGEDSGGGGRRSNSRTRKR